MYVCMYISTYIYIYIYAYVQCIYTPGNSSILIAWMSHLHQYALLCSWTAVPCGREYIPARCRASSCSARLPYIYL